MKLVLSLFILGFSLVAQGQESHELVRRIVVFPFQFEGEYSQLVDDVWWKVRSTLTENKRFLVASKSFLERKDLFQTRGELSPADAIILGELSDAHLVVTASLLERKFSMYAYEAKYGRLIWKHEVVLHPSMSIAEQLPEIAIGHAKDLIMSLPYQGFVIKDSLIGEVVYENNDKLLLQAEVGMDSRVENGDKVQLVRVLNTSHVPLLLGGATIEVFAEGQVVDVKEGRVIVQLERATSIDEVKEWSLVRFPNEIKRLRDLYNSKKSLRRRISPEYYSPEISSLDLETQETKPLVTALSFLFNIATILLLAF